MLKNKPNRFFLAIFVAIMIGGSLFYLKLSPSNQTQETATPESSISSPKETTSNEIISVDYESPDGSYVVKEEALGDHQIISVADSKGKVIMDDLVAKNYQEIGYNEKFDCMCGTHFKGWVDNSRFAIKIVNAINEEFEYLVDASTGRVIESSFRKTQ